MWAYRTVIKRAWCFKGNPLNLNRGILAASWKNGGEDLECLEKKTQSEKSGNYTERATRKGKIKEL